MQLPQECLHMITRHHQVFEALLLNNLSLLNIARRLLREGRFNPIMYSSIVKNYSVAALGFFLRVDIGNFSEGVYMFE